MAPKEHITIFFVPDLLKPNFACHTSRSQFLRIRKWNNNNSDVPSSLQLALVIIIIIAIRRKPGVRTRLSDVDTQILLSDT